MNSPQQQTLEFAPDPDTSGFRLHQLAVYNWGTFHGKPYTLSPDGRTAILTGGNGSGKSTLADALLTLLVPNVKRNYNQAGQTLKRNERNERDYVLGAYSEKHDESDGISVRKKQYLRKGTGSYTVLLATFHNTTLNQWVSLTQVLWINSADKVDKVFLAEPGRFRIEKEFANFESTTAIRRALKDRGLTFYDQFSAYSQRFHSLLFLPQGKTPMEIFNQAICIKDIEELTKFIREFMLDDGGAAEKLSSLRANFTELRATHRRIEQAARQLGELRLINADHTTLTVIIEERSELLLREELLTPYFAEKEIGLREKNALQLEGDHAVKKAEYDQVSENIGVLRSKITAIETELSNSSEGLRLRDIEKDLQVKSILRDERKKRKVHFDETAAEWAANTAVSDIATFNELRAACKRGKPLLTQRIEIIETVELPERRFAKKTKEQRRDELETEKSSLLKRENNIAAAALKIRARILDALHLTPADLPFAGELIQVKENETHWTGAIERLLRNFALGLVARPELRAKIDAFVHETNLQCLVTYHAISETPVTLSAAPAANTVAGKLEIKKDPGGISTWLAAEISRRFDHLCCEDTSGDFRHAGRALTRNGLIKTDGGTRRKDDTQPIDNAAFYVLGWDNSEKIEAIGNELRALEIELETLQKEIAGLEAGRVGINKRVAAAETLCKHYTDFSDIDWSSVAKEIETLEDERKKIQNSSDALKRLQTEKREAQQGLSDAQEHQKTLIGGIAVLEDHIEKNTARMDAVRASLTNFEESAATNAKLANFRAHYASITDSLAFPPTDLSKLDAARNDAANAIRRRLAEKNKEHSDLSHRIKTKMAAFYNHSENIEYKDRLANDYSLSGYDPALFAPFDEIRRKIEEDDLPKNEKRFEKLLHSTVYEDVSNFDQTLHEHSKKISAKIDELNQHLRQIDYDRDEKTFIQLVAEKSNEEAVREFRHLLRNALEGSLNETDDTAARRDAYDKVALVLDRLDKDPDWTTRVIDVRNWFTFRADEYFRADAILKQSYSGASGKSGGEKNRLASTILATAIAYQYGISVNDRQTETFRLVVVDEMFSKTDDEFSTYLLDLFKEFHLQLLIIQPLDAKIHLVQKYVERYHFVTRRASCSSVHTLSVHEYKALNPENRL